MRRLDTERFGHVSDDLRLRNGLTETNRQRVVVSAGRGVLGTNRSRGTDRMTSDPFVGDPALPNLALDHLEPPFTNVVFSVLRQWVQAISIVQAATGQGTFEIGAGPPGAAEAADPTGS